MCCQLNSFGTWTQLIPLKWTWIISLVSLRSAALCRSASSRYSLESFWWHDLQLSSLCLPPSLVLSLWLKLQSLDPSSSADMTAGDVTSWFSDFPVYFCLRLCLVTAHHCEELDMTGLDVILPLHDPLLPPPHTLPHFLSSPGALALCLKRLAPTS